MTTRLKQVVNESQLVRSLGPRTSLASPESSLRRLLALSVELWKMRSKLEHEVGARSDPHSGLEQAFRMLVELANER
jgi:hypothetical protein